MSDLDAILDEAAPNPKKDKWESVGFLRNPFPSRAHPIWDVFHNQDPVRTRFYSDLKEFLRDGTTQTMFFTGGNRVGKTHFMEHHRRKLDGELPGRGIVVPIAVASAESTDFAQFARAVIEQLADSVQRQTGMGLFEHPVPTSLDQLPPGDFRRAMRSLEDAHGEEREERARFLWQWFRGDRVRIGVRKAIDVSSWLDTSANFVNALGAFVYYWRATAHVSNTKRPGVLVFLDEFELVRRARRDRRDQFLQGLRAMIDACGPQGLFLCVGMATGLGYRVDELEQQYPALYARLKGAREIPALIQVGGVVDALQYAAAFEDYGREQFARKRGRQPSKQRFLGEQEVEMLFNQTNQGRSAPQGDFFDSLHTYAEKELAKRAR